MKIVRESLGGYPTGAEYDSRAPWNMDDSVEEIIRLNNEGDIEVVRMKQIGEGDWDEEVGTIDPQDLDRFLAQKHRMDAQRLADAGQSIAIEDVVDSGGGRYEIHTQIGVIRTTFSELEDLL